ASTPIGQQRTACHFAFTLPASAATVHDARMTPPRRFTRLQPALGAPGSIPDLPQGASAAMRASPKPSRGPQPRTPRQSHPSSAVLRSKIATVPRAAVSCPELGAKIAGVEVQDTFAPPQAGREGEPVNGWRYARPHHQEVRRSHRRERSEYSDPRPGIP